MMTDLAPSSAASSVDLAIVAWLDAKSKRSGSTRTLAIYRSTLASFRAALQAAALDLDSDPRAVALAAQGWAGQGLPAPATLNQRLAVLSSFYMFGCKRGLLGCENPIAQVERATVEAYGTAEPIAPAEVKAHLVAIDRTAPAGARDYAVLALALQTGRRVAEIASLRWRDCRVGNEGRITVTFARAKGGKVMRDTLPRPLSAALLGWLKLRYGASLGDLAPDAPIWCALDRRSAGQALSVRSLERIAHERLGVHFHALRHTFARSMEQTGAKVSEIQQRLGHSSLQTTGRYLAALGRDENPHADALAALLGLD